MADFLSAYSIQSWLESCPQGYLEQTEYGHLHDEKGRDLLENEVLRRRTSGDGATRGRRALRLSASSGLINAAPDGASKRFLATQTLDEARHVEVFTHRLFDLGVRRTSSRASSSVREPGTSSSSRRSCSRRSTRRISSPAWSARTSCSRAWPSASSDDVRDERAAEREVRAHAVGYDRRRGVAVVGFGENRIGSLIGRIPAKAARDRAHAEGDVPTGCWRPSRTRSAATTIEELQRLGMSAQQPVPGRGPRRAVARADGARPRRHRARRVQGPAWAASASNIRLRRYRAEGRVSPQTREISRPGARRVSRGGALLQFWFPGGRGVSVGDGGRPPSRHLRRAAGRQRSRPADLDALQLCIGRRPRSRERAVIAIAPNRHQVFLATRVADEAASRGSAAPSRGPRRRRSRGRRWRSVQPSLQLFRLPGSSSWSASRDWEARDLRAERDPQVARVRGVPHASSNADPVTREVLDGVIRTSDRHIGFGENELGASFAHSPHIRAPGTGAQPAPTTSCSTCWRPRAREIGVDRHEQERLGRTYRESVERLGFLS